MPRATTTQLRFLPDAFFAVEGRASSRHISVCDAAKTANTYIIVFISYGKISMNRRPMYFGIIFLKCIESPR